MDRKSVYNLINGERKYQDSLWDGSITCTGAAHKATHSIEEWLLYIEDYLNEAKHISARKSFPDAVPEVMAIVRKIAALVVICMEQHETPPRDLKDLGLSVAHGICEVADEFDNDK